MEYDIRVWKNPDNMPDIEPQKANGKLAQAADKVADAAKNPSTLLNKSQKKGRKPDILIDKDAGGEGVIKSVKISYSTNKVDKGEGKQLVRSIKIDIKGNLYLPLEEGLIGQALNKLTKADSKEEADKLRNTLLLSEWAQVKPEEDGTKQYYRGIRISVMTPAGDFRLITAKNVYVDSYSENYEEGEFGTFEMSLVERIDSNEQFKVDGIGYAEESTFNKVKKVVEKTAKVMAGVAVAAQAGKAITETVEKFTGETPVSRWFKYGFDTAGTASSVTGSASNMVKNPKDIKNVSKELTDINKNLQERLQTAADTKKTIPLEQMEKMYLSWIQADPEAYEKYKQMNYDQKYAALEQAAEDMRTRAAVTKDMEIEERDYYKRENEKNKK